MSVGEPQLRRTFKYFDRDGDGFVTAADAKMAVLSLGIFLNEKQDEELFADSPLVNLESFLKQATRVVSGAKPISDCLTRFKAFDVGGDGKLRVDELTAVLKTLAPQMTDSEIAEMMKMGASGAEHVDYGKLIKALL